MLLTVICSIICSRDSLLGCTRSTCYQRGDTMKFFPGCQLSIVHHFMSQNTRLPEMIRQISKLYIFQSIKHINIVNSPSFHYTLQVFNECPVCHTTHVQVVVKLGQYILQHPSVNSHDSSGKCIP